MEGMRDCLPSDEKEEIANGFDRCNNLIKRLETARKETMDELLKNSASLKNV